MPSTLIREHLETTYFADYLALRGQLFEQLTDDDLDFAVPGNPTLGAICRDMGEVEHSYVESLRTFRQSFAYTHPDPSIERSVERLAAWYVELDRDLAAAIDALTDADVERRIDRGSFHVAPRQQLDIYREALLIFYARVIVYLRAMGKEPPTTWVDWIG